MEDKCFLIVTINGVDYCTGKPDNPICTLATESTCAEWERIKMEEREELEKGVGG